MYYSRAEAKCLLPTVYKEEKLGLDITVVDLEVNGHVSRNASTSSRIKSEAELTP